MTNQRLKRMEAAFQPNLTLGNERNSVGQSLAFQRPVPAVMGSPEI